MENRAGYKKTELGWIPESWEVVNLPEASWFQEGPGLRNWQFSEEGIKVINITNMVDGFLDLSKTKRYISLEEFERQYRHFECDAGDIVIASSGNSYCKHAIVRESDLPLVMNTSVIRFKPLHTTHYNYLNQFLKSNFLKQQIDFLITGGAQPNFGPAHLKQVLLPLPPLPEQQKIASILTTVDDKISSIEAQIQQTEQLKKGLMAKLLTEGIGHTEFKDTEIGMIPESWEVKILIDAAEKISDGIHTTPKYCPDTEYYFINGNNLSKGNIVIDEKTKCVSRSEFLKHKKELNLYTILLSINGTIGNLAFYNNEKVILGKSASYIILSKHIDKQYVYYLLQTDKIQKYFLLEVTGTTIKNLSIKSIKNCKIPLPPLPEQQQIASILSSVDDKLDVLQSKKTSYSTLKKGLMAKLLTGQMRVKI